MKFYARIHHHPSRVIELATLAEELGFDGISLADHVAVPDPMPRNYPHNESGLPVFGHSTPFPDLWVLAGALAAVTTRLDLLANVYILPLRHPVQVARTVGTAAVLAEGRVSLGVGVGWMEEEFKALGANFKTRGAYTDESIKAMRALWAGGSAEFHGTHIDFDPLVMEPKPPKIPILVGGTSERAYRRAVELSDGYIAVPLPLAELDQLVRHLKTLRADSPRAADPFVFHGRSNWAETVDDYRSLEEIGFDAYTWNLVAPGDSLDKPIGQIRDKMKRFADEIIAGVRD